MSEIEPEDAPSSAKLLRMIQERSDDLDKVVILPPGLVLAEQGAVIGSPVPHFIMMLHYSDGSRQAIFGGDIEVVLNDGILNRMKIRIELRGTRD